MARTQTGGTVVRLFWFFVVLYLLSTSGKVWTPDGVVMGRATEGLLLHGDFRVDPRGIPADFLAPGREGASFGKYAPGLSLVAAPFGLLGRGLAAIAPSWSVDAFTGAKVLWYRPRDPADVWFFLGLGLTNALVVAGTVALLFLLALETGSSPRTALGVCAVAGLASPLWPYAKDFFAEPLGAFGLVGCALFAERFARRRSGWDALLSGLGLGVAVLAKVSHLVLVAAAAGPALHAFLMDSRRAPPERRAVLQWALGWASCLVLVGLFNGLRFGDPFRTGYEGELNRWSTPILTGLAGLLISPGHGLVPYFPAVLLAAWLTPRAWNRNPRTTALAWLCVTALVGLHTRWHGWNGGWCYGPRFLVPAIPLLALLLAPFFEETQRGLKRIVGWTLLVASAWMALSGVAVSYADFHQAALERLSGQAYFESLWWDWSFFPGWAYLGFEPRGFLFFVRLLREPSLCWMAGLFGAGVVLLVPLGIACWRATANPLGGQAPLARRSPRRPVKTVPGVTRWIWPASALVVGFVCVWVARGAGPAVTTHFDFERPRYDRGWSVEGVAFGSGPLAGNPTSVGRGVVSSASSAGIAATGRLLSPEFVLRGTRATFYVGGGREPERIAVRLLVGGRAVAEVSGTGSDAMARAEWDLSSFQGSRARLELIDASESAALYFDDFRVVRAR